MSNENKRDAAWIDIPIVPLLTEMDETGEQIPDPRLRAMAMVWIGFNRGYAAGLAEGIPQGTLDGYDAGHANGIARETLDKIGKE